MSVTDDALGALSRDGFYFIHDVRVGEHIAEMDRNGSQFSSSSKAGIDFYKVNVFQNEVRQSPSPVTLRYTEATSLSKIYSNLSSKDVP